MRHNDARKWLHATLDLLPVILIPVFMIYSHRHTIDNGSIQVAQKQVVDFNQLVSPKNTNIGNASITYDNYLLHLTTNGVECDNSGGRLNRICENIHFDFGNKYYFRFNSLTGLSLLLYSSNSSNNSAVTLFDTSTIYSPTLTYDGIIGFNVNAGVVYDYYSYFNVFNLTQMFGAGNEPTKQQFDSYYADNYYEFTLSHKELLVTGTATYDDTDIMSQFTYQMYNAVDKYFNMGNVFNLGNVYQWFELNIFGGSAPLYIYIVWQIVLYEFVMDLLFLLYGLFMWFIDMVKHIMEKPFRSIK